MYRAIALKATRHGLTASQATEASLMAEDTQIAFGKGHPAEVLLDGEDVSDHIRSIEIGQLASLFSVHPGVRRALVRRQREIIEAGGYILEGRDVTTIVAPNAHLKIFLTASIEERARRRWHEMRERNPELRLQDVVKDVVERDFRDYTRQDSPLCLAEDAHIVETTGLSPAAVVEELHRLLNA